MHITIQTTMHGAGEGVTTTLGEGEHQEGRGEHGPSGSKGEDSLKTILFVVVVVVVVALKAFWGKNVKS